MKFTHWVFDLDGTLIDSSGQYELLLKTILAEAGRDLTAEELERAFHYFDPAAYFATIFDQPLQNQQAVKRLVELNLELATSIDLYPGIAELLEFLRARDVQVSVWTGRDLASLEKILAHTGISRLVGVRVSRSCVARNKPAPDGLLKVLQDSRRHGDETVMIGDHDYDMQGAREAGVAGVSVGWDPRAPQGARLLSAHHFFKVPELREWAETLYPRAR